MRPTRLLLVDVPSYRRQVCGDYASLLRARVGAEAMIAREVLGTTIRRGPWPYSRGMLQLAGAAIGAGHSVQYVSNFDPAFDQRLLDELPHAEVLGLTCMTASYHVMKGLARLAREVNPDITIVVGGPHITSTPDLSRSDLRDADVLVTGPGEVRLLEILAAVSEGRGPRRAAGIDLPIIQHGARMQSYPAPAYGLLSRPLGQYAHNVLTQEGCKYRCDYCVEEILPFRRFPIDEVMKELRFLDERLEPGDLVYISDDVITADSKRLLQLAPRMRDETRNISFVCEMRAEDVSKAHVQALADARFVQMNIGIEDASDLKFLGRRVTFDMNVKACNLIREYSNALIGVHWVTGLPGSTRKSLSLSVEAIQHLIDSHTVDVVSNKIFVPYPGTAVHAQFHHYRVALRHVANWADYDRLSPPVCDLESDDSGGGLKSEAIWAAFLEAENVLVQAYSRRLGVPVESLADHAATPLHANNFFTYLQT